MDDAKRSNIWEDNVTDGPPPIEYKELQDVISFEDFDFTKYRTGEETILQPRLEELGYTHVQWAMGEFDSFGPLTRICQARDRNGTVSWFIYG